MRVYFIGCHGSGKTTCARYVAKKHNLLLITEVARMVLSENELQVDSLRYDMSTVNDYQSSVFYRQLSEEQKYTSYVSDRSGLDSLAYSAQHSNILPRLLAAPELPPYLDILRKSDSILFFVRPCKKTLKADGVRENITFEGAVAIDAQIKFLLEMWELRYFQINIDNMQERVRLIDNVLSLHKE